MIYYIICTSLKLVGIILKNIYFRKYENVGNLSRCLQAAISKKKYFAHNFNSFERKKYSMI